MYTSSYIPEYNIFGYRAESLGLSQLYNVTKVRNPSLKTTLTDDATTVK